MARARAFPQVAGDDALDPPRDAFLSPHGDDARAR